MRLSLEDWNEINDPEFIKRVEFVGGRQWNRLNDERHAGREIRRFNLRGAQEAQDVAPGSVVELVEGKKLVVSWHDLRNWPRADEHDHYGRLYFLAPINGVYKTWWIEKLRHPVETGGTGGAGQLDARAWRYEDGEQYPDWWAIAFDGKLESPVRNRENDPDGRYRPPRGSLCGLWVGGWRDTRLYNGADARTDIFPVRYGGETPPSPPPPPPDLDYETGYNDAIVDAIAELERLKKTE